jgi:hypothetical protein
MKSLRWITFLTLILMIAGTCALPISSTAVPAHSPTPELMKVGKSKQFGTDLRVKFLGVKKDRRCPIDQECKSPGDAEILLKIKIGSQRAKIYSLHSYYNKDGIRIPINKSDTTKRKRYYVIKMATLTPQPIKGKVTPVADYQLDLDVSIRK